MTAAFSANEIRYLTAWVIEDHLGKKEGPARILQRRAHVHSAVLGNMIAHMCRALGRNEMDIVDGSYPEGPIDWPWPTKELFEARLKELLPESSIHYLEELGALTLEKVTS